MRCSNMKTENIREITKKEKVRGLTLTSWKIALITSGGLIPQLGIFKAVPLFAFLVAVFYILEFFDDDIMEIIMTKFKLGAKDEYIA